MEWWHLLWFNLAIPKHSFVGWIVILSKLSTKARILQQGLPSSSEWFVCFLQLWHLSSGTIYFLVLLLPRGSGKLQLTCF